MANACGFCGIDATSLVGTVPCCKEHATVAWRAVTTAASPPQTVALNARELVNTLRSTIANDKGRAALDALEMVLWPPLPTSGDVRDVADIAMMLR